VGKYVLFKYIYKTIKITVPNRKYPVGSVLTKDSSWSHHQGGFGLSQALEFVYPPGLGGLGGYSLCIISILLF